MFLLFIGYSFYGAIGSAFVALILLTYLPTAIKNEREFNKRWNERDKWLKEQLRIIEECEARENAPKL